MLALVPCCQSALHFQGLNLHGKLRVDRMFSSHLQGLLPRPFQVFLTTSIRCKGQVERSCVSSLLVEYLFHLNLLLPQDSYWKVIQIQCQQLPCHCFHEIRLLNYDCWFHSAAKLQISSQSQDVFWTKRKLNNHQKKKKKEHSYLLKQVDLECTSTIPRNTD